jgi:hypothetical protein
MTRDVIRTSVEWGADPAANGLEGSNLTSSSAGTSIPFDNDTNDEDFFDSEAGWYV